MGLIEPLKKTLLIYFVGSCVWKEARIIFQTPTVYLSSCVQNYRGTLCTVRDSLPLGRVSTGDALP